MRYEQRSTITHIQKRNRSTQVLVKENLDSSTPEAITELMDGGVHDLFFMRDAGYLVLGRATDRMDISDGSSEWDLWYDRIDLGGSITALGGGTVLSMLSCDGGESSSSVAPPIRFIPSPDGSLLAKFESNTTCNQRTQTITFLDALSLEVVMGPKAVPDLQQNMGFWPTIELAWLAGDGFAVGHWGSGITIDHYSTTIFYPDGSQEENQEVHISCFYPLTTSSDVSGAKQVQIDEHSGVISIANSANNTSYGCFE